MYIWFLWFQNQIFFWDLVFKNLEIFFGITQVLYFFLYIFGFYDLKYIRNCSIGIQKLKKKIWDNVSKIFTSILCIYFSFYFFVIPKSFQICGLGIWKFWNIFWAHPGMIFITFFSLIFLSSCYSKILPYLWIWYLKFWITFLDHLGIVFISFHCIKIHLYIIVPVLLFSVCIYIFFKFQNISKSVDSIFKS